MNYRLIFFLYYVLKNKYDQVIVAAPPSQDGKDCQHEEQGHSVYSEGGRQGHWGSDRFYLTDQVQHIQ